MTAADELRRQMIETGQPHADLAAALGRRCLRCGADLADSMGCQVFADGKPAPGLLCIEHGAKGANGLTRAEYERLLAAQRTWTTAELQRDFDVLGFAAPFVVVRRKADGMTGTLEFTRSPRVYFGWQEDDADAV